MDPHGLHTDGGGTPHRQAPAFQKVALREAIYADLEWMLSLDNRLFNHYAAYDMSVFVEFLVAPDVMNLIAEVEGRKAGFVIANFGSGRTVGVVAIDIEPVFQNRGIGTFIMNHMEKLAREKHAYVLCLQVSTINEGAIRFYERLGYVRTRFLKDYYSGFEDAWEMKKKLR